MRKTLQRGIALISCMLFALLGVFAPPANAQDEPLEPIDCVAIGQIQVDEYSCQPGEDTLTPLLGNPRPTTEPEPTPTPEPDEILPVVQVPASPPLAITGSNVDGPVLVGFSLIGAGGLALLLAKARRDRD